MNSKQSAINGLKLFLKDTEPFAQVDKRDIVNLVVLNDYENYNKH